jgi:hypothetical protein
VYSQYGKANAYGLKMGDRIVWISDDGPEAGVVKWIGLLPDCRADDDITVGVEFVRSCHISISKQKKFNLKMLL